MAPPAVNAGILVFDFASPPPGSEATPAGTPPVTPRRPSGRGGFAPLGRSPGPKTPPTAPSDSFRSPPRAPRKAARGSRWSRELSEEDEMPLPSPQPQIDPTPTPARPHPPHPPNPTHPGQPDHFETPPQGVPVRGGMGSRSPANPDWSPSQYVAKEQAKSVQWRGMSTEPWVSEPKALPLMTPPYPERLLSVGRPEGEGSSGDEGEGEGSGGQGSRDASSTISSPFSAFSGVPFDQGLPPVLSGEEFLDRIAAAQVRLPDYKV